jgi:hypothetical protein
MHTLPAYPAPEVFVVAPATLQPPPAPAVETTLPNCRTDLFGLGDGRTNVQADLWEECQAETPAEREATASKPRDEITEPETTSENVNVEVNESHVLFSADGGGESGGE